MATDSPPVRPPVQARSRRTLTRILDASLALLAERGPEGVTVQDIVARARTSVGSFYARFSGKEELLAFLEQGAWTRARAHWDEELAARIEEGASLNDRIQAIVALLVEMNRDETLSRWNAADGEGGAFAAHMRGTVVRILFERRADIRHADPERAIGLGYAAVTGAVRERPDGWEDGPLVEELTRLWRGYLGRGDSDARGTGKSVDYFEVWT